MFDISYERSAEMAWSLRNVVESDLTAAAVGFDKLDRRAAPCATSSYTSEQTSHEFSVAIRT